MKKLDLNSFQDKDLHKLESYDYYLPQELIAQSPIEPRDKSRLMVVNKTTGEISHRIFSDIKEYLKEGDLLVFNVSKVIPARLLGKKTTGANVEVLLVEKLEPGIWKCLVKPGKAIKEGTEVLFERNSEKLLARCIDRAEEGTRIFSFSMKGDNDIFFFGTAPLPHYIKTKDIDIDRYQTVYAREEGSIAAPTAGLHFTTDLLEKIRQKGIKFAEVTLHVGIGTFRPVKVGDITQHKMHEEYYIVSEESAKAIEECHKNGGRIVAVGTTSVRTLETIAKLPKAPSYSGKTNLFIYPPYEFKYVDALITNFHLPKSSLIMLVSAFAGYELTMKAYNIAVEEKYRFFSFGDACFFF